MQRNAKRPYQIVGVDFKGRFIRAGAIAWNTTGEENRRRRQRTRDEARRVAKAWGSFGRSLVAFLSTGVYAGL